MQLNEPQWRSMQLNWKYIEIQWNQRKYIENQWKCCSMKLNEAQWSLLQLNDAQSSSIKLKQSLERRAKRAPLGERSEPIQLQVLCLGLVAFAGNRRESYAISWKLWGYARYRPEVLEFVAQRSEADKILSALPVLCQGRLRVRSYRVGFGFKIL